MYEALVRNLRRCSFASVADYDRQADYCKPCAYFKSDEDITCMDMMMIDAADALESSDKNCAYLGDRVAELIAENEELKQEIERLKPFEKCVNKAHDDGMWEMFQLITSAEYGKQRFFDDYHGTVYDRSKGDHLKDRDAATDRFLDEIEEVWGSI